MKIRVAKKEDLDEIFEIESSCFLKTEAATKEVLAKRLDVFNNHFLILEDGKILSFVDTMVTDSIVLDDEMYHNPSLHQESGKYVAILGVATKIKHRNKGYAKMLLLKLIEKAKCENRKGIILTCKKELISFYEQVGFKNMGKSSSSHGNVLWYQMNYII